MTNTELRTKIQKRNQELEALLKSHFSLRMQVAMQQLAKTIKGNSQSTSISHVLEPFYVRRLNYD